MLLNFSESLDILNKYEIPTVESYVVENDEGLFSAMEKIPFPFVMKIDSREIIHKTDKGGVVLGISSREEAVSRLRELLEICDGGVIVQKQTEGEEIIIGGKRDEVFGPVVMVGLGGIFVEIYKDIVFGLAPLNKKEALNMINSIKGKKILEGFRGRPSVNKEALAEVLERTSNLIQNEPQVKELDLNPVLVGENSLVCDVKILI